MSKKSYTKPALLYTEQIIKLKSRGLIINNTPKALHLLQHLSYYRLSGYWYTLLDHPKKNHRFKIDATFDQAFDLYCFDRELRQLILNQIEKIEVSVRATIAYECSHSWGAFWLSDKNNFKNDSEHKNTILKISKEIDRSKELFLQEYDKKYLEKLPPSWITLEVCSIGSLSWVYRIIKPGKTKREISRKYGLNEKVFETWLHSLVYIRNICAHHSRLWNKKLAIKPEIPKNFKGNWIVNTEITDSRNHSKNSIKNKTYFTICIVQYLLNIINPKNNFKENLDELFDKYPNIDLKAMDYTSNWREETLWSQKKR
ncbi:Abi family protein [Cellulophaga baltica]|uniref:Abortive infection bacteriophage resistance protein n=1 Tax=Cellulophaga baltica TaxID=76594 RepID=A0A1G7DDC4_9FLAO|nr:Abi family protein [Cellulophaga baltica]SDE49542.1 Abortive infection bacteriophage resistance protein [Cellulophaga baltica]